MDIRKLLTAQPDLTARAFRLHYEPETPFPLLVAKIKLTWRCNLRCTFCGLWRKPAPPSLDRATVIDLLGSLARAGLRKVHFSGGEVCLYEDLEAVVAAARDLDLQVNITTNGTLLNKNIAKMLTEARVHTTAFSLDASTERRHDDIRGLAGAWRMTWKGIRRLLERREQKGRGPRIAVNTVITRRNVDQLPDLYLILQENKIDAWRLLPVRTTNKKLRPRAEQWTRLAEQWDDWRPLFSRNILDSRQPDLANLARKGWYAGRSLDRHPCYAPWFSLFVDADGEVYPCCTGRNQMPTYGNIHQTPINQLCQSVPRQEIKAGMASGHVFQVCRSCDEFFDENEVIGQTRAKEAPPCPND
jgi:radical SAM protein with 4Fe4S-binding SPASM domain